MHKMLLAIKTFLAFNPMKQSINDTMQTIVMENYIKPVQKALELNIAPNKQQQYQQQLSTWQSLYDDNNVWEKVVYNQTKNLKQTALLDDYIADGLSEVYAKRNELARKVNPFKSSPRDLINYVGRLIANHINDKLRHDVRHSPGDEVDVMTDDQGRDRSIFDTMESPSMGGGDEPMAEMMGELKEWIKKHDDDRNTYMTLFEVWMKAFERNQNLNFSNIVKMLEKRLGLAESSIRRSWAMLKQMIVDFFEKQLGYRLTNKQKDALKVSTITILAMEYKLAYEETRRQMARFVLGGLHEQVGVEFESPDKVVAIIREERKNASEKKKIARREPPYPPSALDGMSNEKARKVVNNVLRKHIPTGLQRDNSWSPIHKAFDALDAEKIIYDTTSSEYSHNDEGRPNGKKWTFEVYFTNKTGRPTILNGHITAHGAGTVQDLTETYDITALVY